MNLCVCLVIELSWDDASLVLSSKFVLNTAENIAFRVYIEQPGEYKLSVMITTPDNTTLTSQTVETVIVRVDSPSEESYPISADSVELVGWSLDSGCYFAAPTVSATKVTVYGPTLEIDTIDKVKIRTSSIGKASDKMTVAAEVVLLDKYGDTVHTLNLLKPCLECHRTSVALH